MVRPSPPTCTFVDRGGFTMDEAYSLASVAIDLGVTQVVDGTVGCHAAVARQLID